MTPHWTGHRIEALRQALTERDLAVIDMLATTRLAMASQIQRVVFADVPSGPRQCRRTLAKLTQLEAVIRLERSVGGRRGGSESHIYALGIPGQRLATTGGPAGGDRLRRPWTPGLPFLKHSVAVTELYVRLKEAERRGGLRVRFFDTEPYCWRHFSGPQGGVVTLKPDAYIKLQSDTHDFDYFLERDLATESPATIARKAKAYAAYLHDGREQATNGVFPLTLWVVPDEARQAVLRRVLWHQPVSLRTIHRVETVDQAVVVMSDATA